MTNDELAIQYQEAMDALDLALNDSVESISDKVPDGKAQTEVEPESDELGPTHDICVGDKIEVHWPLEDKYFPAPVAPYNMATGLDGISYDDDDSETINIEQANIITSHVIYKVKDNHDGSLKMEARNAPHRNKDKDRHELKIDCA